MAHVRAYETPEGFGNLWMRSDGESLTGLWFAGTRGEEERETGEEVAVLRETRRWLDAYFGGRPPRWSPRWRLEGASPFREAVLREVLAIPFGATETYGGIAARIARGRGGGKMSAQAVGGAVGWNPVCLVIPCHRVVGAGGTLTGYGGGLENKTALLAWESRGRRDGGGKREKCWQNHPKRMASEGKGFWLAGGRGVW